MGANQSQSSPPTTPSPPRQRVAASSDEVMGFSADTKAVFRPSIPFKMRYGVHGSRSYQDFTVDTITMYHPCPLRLEGVQPDAVLSLNDPSFGNPTHVVLIPLVGKNLPGPSVSFIEKIASHIVTISSPDPSTGQYLERDIPTGADWSLQKLFSTQRMGDWFEVTSGYYVWEAMPALKRVRRESPGIIEFVWEEDKSEPVRPTYIMLDKPAPCNPTDIAILTQRMPVTPTEDAIHAVNYQGVRGAIFHKPGPPGASCPTKETFTDVQSVYALADGTQEEDEACDAWTYWANRGTRGFTSQQFTETIFGVFVFIAMALGAYIALAAVLRMYDVKVADLSAGIGKIVAVFARNLQQKATVLRERMDLRALASQQLNKLQ